MESPFLTNISTPTVYGSGGWTCVGVVSIGGQNNWPLGLVVNNPQNDKHHKVVGC